MISENLRKYRYVVLHGCTKTAIWNNFFTPELFLFLKIYFFKFILL